MGLLGSSTKVRNLSTLQAPQQQALNTTGGAIGDLTSRIRQAIRDYGGSISGDVREAQERTLSNLPVDINAARSAFMSQLSGDPTFQFDFGEFDERVASPLIQSFRQHLEPVIRENLAFQGGAPGSFYSSNVGRGVGQAAQQFYTSNILPQIEAGLEREFMAKESAAGRQLQAGSAVAGLGGAEAEIAGSIEQQLLNNILASLGLSTQFATTPTTSTVVKQGSSMVGDLIKAGTSLASAAMIPATGGLSAFLPAVMGNLGNENVPTYGPALP